MDEKLIDYIVNVVDATRNPKSYGLDIENLIEYGASPRASIYLTKAAKAHAFLNHRGYVIPDDIKKAAPDVIASQGRPDLRSGRRRRFAGRYYCKSFRHHRSSVGK